MSVEGIKRTIINTAAVEIVEAIEKDLRARPNWFDDPEAEREVRLAWQKIVAAGIKKALGE